LITGTSQKVPVSSDPPGVTVEVDGKRTFITPCRLKLERKKDHTLIFTKEGYHQKTVTLFHVICGTVCGNMFLGGPAGWAVDAITGAQYRLAPADVHVEMEKIDTGETVSAAPKKEKI
jgi:hypothetical protein